MISYEENQKPNIVSTLSFTRALQRTCSHGPFSHGAHSQTGEAANNQTVTVQGGNKHYENVMSKQESEHRKGISELSKHLLSQGGLPGGGDIVLNSKEHHLLEKRAGGQGGSISGTGNHVAKKW